MSKNKILILILTTLILATGLFYFWIKYIKKTAPARTSDTTTDIFPFDSGAGQGSQFSSSAPYGDNQSSFGDSVDMPTLRQISDKPTAGGVAFNNGSTTIIRYVERGTGHIIETTTESFESRKISNTTIPKVSQAIWSPGGQSVIMRYTKDGSDNIFSFSADIVKATTTQDVSKNSKSVFLPSNITQVSVNPSGDTIFYLTKDSGGATGYISNINDSKKSQIFKSPITEWLVSWTNKEIISLATKPSYTATGYLFFLNKKTGVNNKILGGINGLTALVSSTTKNILYSESDDDLIKLHSYNLKNNKNNTLSFKTLPEKCVWSKIEEFIVYCAVPQTLIRGEYPDDWYQGLISFNDTLWKINLKTNSSEPIYNPKKESDKEFDIVDSFLSDNDDYLFFINKKDLTFWSLSIKKQKINKAMKNSNSF